MKPLEKHEDEGDLQEWLQERFELAGWKTRREVTDVTGTNRADLVVSSDEYGVFGIETKFYARDGGALLADAHHQVVAKYRQTKFQPPGSISSKSIELWAVCFLPEYLSSYAHGDETEDFYERWGRFRQKFSREMLCRHGVGFIYPGGNNLVIDFAYSRSECKVPVESCTRHEENVDVDAIREMVRKKMAAHKYNESIMPPECDYDADGVGCSAEAEVEMVADGFEVELCKHHARQVQKRERAEVTK